MVGLGTERPKGLRTDAESILLADLGWKRLHFAFFTSRKLLLVLLVLMLVVLAPGSPFNQLFLV